MIKDEYAKDAINQFVQESCAFIFPGEKDNPASEVGSGTILQTPKGRIAVLTAKHIANIALNENFRLGYYNCEAPLNDFVAGVLLHPGDVDVAFLIVKDIYTPILNKYSVTLDSVPIQNYKISDSCVLLLCGYPSEMSNCNLENKTQGFKSLTYWCDLPLEECDKKGRIKLEWGDAQRWGSKEPIDLPAPKGISGGPLWCFQRPDVGSIWSPGSIGNIIGVQSAWDRRTTIILEPIEKWKCWFKKSIEIIENS